MTPGLDARSHAVLEPWLAISLDASSPLYNNTVRFSSSLSNVPSVLVLGTVRPLPALSLSHVLFVVVLLTILLRIPCATTLKLPPVPMKSSGLANDCPADSDCRVPSPQRSDKALLFQTLRLVPFKSLGHTQHARAFVCPRLQLPTIALATVWKRDRLEVNFDNVQLAVTAS